MKLIVVTLMALSLSLPAQDPIFTNARQSLLHLNPSFAGSNGLLRVQSIYRNQWYDLGSPYITYYNSIDAYLKPMRGGIGFSYMHDNQANGSLITNRFDLSYAQHLSFLDKKLKIIPSIQFSFFQKTLDNTKLNFGDYIDSRRGYVWSQGPAPVTATKSNVDVSAGLIVNYRHLYIGGSLFHITQPEEGLMSTSKLPVRLSVFSSYNFFIGDNVLLNAMYRLEHQQNFLNHGISLNALFFKHLMAEAGIASHATHAMLGFRHNYFTVSGSYIFAINSYNSRFGTYEIAASFNLRNKEDRKLIKDIERW